MSSETVRDARLALARALARVPGGADEAEQQLRLLLSETSRRDSWLVLSELARVHRDVRRDSGAAFDGFVAATVEAPTHDSASVAAEAVALLASEDGMEAARRLPVAIVDRLTAAADDLGGEVARLAARVRLLRGDLQEANTLVRDHVDLASSHDPTLRAASVASQVGDLLDQMKRAEAAALLDANRDLASDPALIAMRAACLYANGDLEEALSVSESGPLILELAVFRALTWLRLAASTDGGDREQQISQAMEAAAAVARHQPLRAEPLVLRAQVLLEAGENIAEGRQLLMSGLRRLGGPPEDILWWRLQSQVRDDEFYGYFAVEVAAALHRDNDIVATAETLSFMRTDYRQDGAARELWAGALERRGEVDAAADLYLNAVGDYKFVGEDREVLRVLREYVRIRPSISEVLDLVERLWTATFDAHQDTMADELLSEGRRLLRSVDDQVPTSHVGLAALLWGLLLQRRAVLSDTRSGADWSSLPYFLLAANLRPDSAYFAAHAAGAFSDLDLTWPALQYAERALALLPDDEWVQETVLIMRLNWHGALDSESLALLDGAESPWRETMTALVRLLAGDLAGLVPLLGSIQVDAMWARQLLAYATARCHGFEEARDLFEGLRREALSGGKHAIVAEMALLVALDDVDKYVALAINNDEIHERRTSFVRSLQALLITDGAGGVESLRSRLSTVARPYRLLEFVEMDAPIIAAAHPDKPGARRALSELADVARARLDVLPVAPTAKVDVETGEAWCSDDRMAALVFGLMEAAAAIRDGRSNDAKEALERIDTDLLREGRRTSRTAVGLLAKLAHDAGGGADRERRGEPSS